MAKADPFWNEENSLLKFMLYVMLQYETLSLLYSVTFSYAQG